MHTPESVEAVLARLMPAPLSDAGQRDMEAMIDRLAAEESIIQPVAEPPAGPRRVAWWISGAAAALVAGFVALSGLVRTTPGDPGQASTQADQPEFLVVGGSGRIESMTDEGWQEGRDGSAMRALRLKVVEENRLLDQETGIVMSVRQPREEVFLMPVTAF